MANLIPIILVFGLVLLGFASTSSATTYNVGDTSGWDISTDLSTWSKDKKFNVGDVLWFQYSSSNSVSQVTKESFQSCNTNKVIKSYSGGNTNVTLSRPGDWYFVSGNKLYCLGGMKLKAEVLSNQVYAPAGAPLATNGQDLPQPSSKSNIPSSAALTNSGPNAVMLTIFGLAAALYVSM